MELSFSGRLGYHCELGAMQDADTWNMVCHTPYFDLTLFSFSPQVRRRKKKKIKSHFFLLLLFSTIDGSKASSFHFQTFQQSLTLFKKREKKRGTEEKKGFCQLKAFYLIGPSSLSHSLFLASTSLGLIPVRTWVDSPLPHSPKDGFIIGRKEKERERPQQLANLFHEFRPCVFGMKSS